MITWPELGLVALAAFFIGLPIGFRWADSLWSKHSAQAREGHVDG